ncbi:MAG: AsnC family transcriptional regulator [Actinobacteria bacterium]|nr:AsnC family transcriptional regulator [Actinomycetota bacterium]MTA78644.1 AsnC family transcriptional regulator [Actinomycetota bacterium]
MMATQPEKPTWTFFTNHGHVLVCLAAEPDLRTRDVAELVGITERSAQSIIADLVDAGYLTRIKVGRRNRYEVHADKPLRHSLERDHTVGELLVTLGKLPKL